MKHLCVACNSPRTTCPHLHPPKKTCKPQWHAPAVLHESSNHWWARWTQTQHQHHNHLPAGFVYSKSTSHCVCLGVVARSSRVCVHARVCPVNAWMCTHEPAGLSVFASVLVSLSACVCVCVCVCVRVRLIIHLTQTNPWAIITSSPQLKCLSYFIYGWYTSVFPKTMESL